MASRYNKKQGIDGIVTLSNDPIAVQNVRKSVEEQKRQIEKAKEHVFQQGAVLKNLMQ